MLISIAFLKYIGQAFLFANLPAATAFSLMIPSASALLAMIAVLYFGAALLFDSAESMPRRLR